MALLSPRLGSRRRSARWPALLGLSALAGLAARAADDMPAVSALKKMSLEQLMDLEVTSVSRRPEKLSGTASAIQVITSEDVRRSGASTMAEALRLAGNLDVAQKNSHDWGISARGFNTELANKLLVMIDGRTVYTPLYSGVFWDRQDYLLEDIDRIEVISGPGGTLWGANAVNGVINIVTKNAKDTPGGYVETGGGTELRHFTGVRYGGSLAPDVRFRVYGKYFDRGSGVLSSGSDAADPWHMAQGGFRLDSEASPQNTLTLQGDIYRGKENAATGDQAKFGGGNLLGRWSHTFAKDSDLSLQWYYDRTHLATPVPKNTFAPAGVLTDDLDTYDLDFQHRFPFGGYNQVVWGLGYRFTHDVVVNAPAVGFLPAKLDQRLFSGFLQNETMLRSDLSLTVGSKIERNSYTGTEFEPSGRLQWNLSNHRMLWGAVSRAVRTPSRIDRDLIEPTYLAARLPQNLLMGGAAFVAETVIAYELGYRAQLGSQGSASVSIFHNVYDHVRSTTPTPPFGFPFYFENNVEGETDGLECSATYQVLDGWRLRGGYDLLKAHLRVKPGKTDLNNALNETADPEQQFSLHSSWDLPDRLELDTGLRWVDSLRLNNGGKVGTRPGYAELDVRLGWHPTAQLELSLVGQNLLHAHHLEFGNPDPAREEIQRSVYGKATWRY